MGVETDEETGAEEEKEEEKEEKEEKERKEKSRPEQSKVKKIQINAKEMSKSASAPPKAELRRDKDEWFQPEGELAVDVFQTDSDIIIQSTIAGMKPEDIDLSIEDDMVTISGERKNPSATEGEEEHSYFYQECYWGPFSRQIILPEEVDFSEAEATMKEGIFTLRLPKLQRQKVRKIKVRG